MLHTGGMQRYVSHFSVTAVLRIACLLVAGALVFVGAFPVSAMSPAAEQPAQHASEEAGMSVSVSGLLTMSDEGTLCVKSGSGKSVKTYIIDKKASERDIYDSLKRYVGKRVHLSCIVVHQTTPWRITVAAIAVLP